jgi:predicted amidohydrolase
MMICAEGALKSSMVDQVSIGICQNSLTYDFEHNIKRAVAMADQAADMGADIVVFTEMFFTPYEPKAIRSAEPFSSQALDAMKAKAFSKKIYIVTGSMPWKSQGERLYNRAYVLSPEGEIIFHHDKIHLFDCTPPGGPVVKESEVIIPGSSLKHFETPWGNASVIVCYDIRFTPLTQLLADKDVRLLFIPAAFSQATGKAHWEMLVRMRAVELQAFVIGVQPAYNPDLKYIPWGHSMIASPWGEILLDAGTDETVQVVKLDLTEIHKIRAQFPLCAHRRVDLYQTVWKGGS